jgi:predicted DNA-binding transcriptional regulator AlpA
VLVSNDLTPNATDILRRKELIKKLGVSPSTFGRMQKDDDVKLPPAIKISEGVRGWRRGDIDTWIEKRAVR